MDNIDKAPAVLVVEDEIFVRMVAADALADSGIRIYEAGNAAEALAVLEDHPDIALLFTDVNMPGEMDGMKLAEKVHAMRPAMQVIVTSGRQAISNAAVPDDGVFLPKPYRLSDLVRLVETKLENAA